MASFWSMSDGSKPTGEVSEPGVFKPIINTWCKTTIEQAIVKEWEGVKSINLKVHVVDGEHKNRTLYLKLKTWDKEESKRDRAINIATKISKILGVDEPKSEPDDDYFAQWQDGFIDILIDTFYPKDGSKPDGHLWIVNVEAKGTKAGGAAKPAAKPAGKAKRDPGDDEGEDAPF
jgi:hypothetical protein